LAALGTAAWLLVLVVSQNAADTPGPSATNSQTPSPHSTAPTRPATHQMTVPTTAPKHSAVPKPVPVGQTVPLGVYAGPGAPVAAAAFTADAGAPVPYAFDYIDGTSWQSISNPLWFMQRWSGSGFRMIWGIPMLPNTGGTLAAGAAGQYDAYFSQLAYTLVDHGEGASIIMLGWDAEAPDLPWSALNSTEAGQYVAFWRQIVNSMRTVQGQQFQFAWDGAPGTNTIEPPALYPGNAFVDIVGTDAFDQGGPAVGLGWSGFAATPYGPNWYATFAVAHHKPLMIAKWGVVPLQDSGGGDSSNFVQQFLRWADKQHLFAAVTWDYGSWAVTGGSFPHAAAELRNVAAAGAVTPIARAVETRTGG